MPKEKGAAGVSTAAPSEISLPKGRKPTGKEPKPSNVTPQDEIDILNADLNRIRTRFGTVTLANTSTGKTCIVLPVEVGWCLRCNNIMLRNESNLCERHSNDKTD